MIPKAEDLFDLAHTLAKELLLEEAYPFLALPKIKEFVGALIRRLPEDEYDRVGDDVLIAKDAEIASTATIEGPTVIGRKAKVRPGAYIRGAVLVGDDAVVGNSTEIKNAIVFDGVQIPHYNYVGDSILGYRAHMGAGAIASNFRLDHGNVTLKLGGEKRDTGLRKFGVLLGDFAEVGCGSVLNPGTIVGRETVIYPLSSVGGIIPERCVVKGGEIKRREI